VGGSVGQAPTGLHPALDGAAADASGNIYVPTSNGTFNAASGGRDYGDSVLKLVLAGSSIEIRDYFTPYNQSQLSDADADLGSSGPLVLPDQPGSHRYLLLQPTKGGMVYVIDASYHGAPLSLGYLQRAVLYSAHQGFSASG
jgi:hypothetical protein